MTDQRRKSAALIYIRENGDPAIMAASTRDIGDGQMEVDFEKKSFQAKDDGMKEFLMAIINSTLTPTEGGVQPDSEEAETWTE